MTKKRRFPPDSSGHETVRFDCEIGWNATKRWCFDHAEFPPCRHCDCGACANEEAIKQTPPRMTIVDPDEEEPAWMHFENPDQPTFPPIPWDARRSSR